MTLDLLVAMIVFGISNAMTPGPNNLMMMTSGVNFGFRATLPHMSGVILGFALMMALFGLGLGGLFTAFPALFMVVKVAGVLYLLWLAWKIANTGPIKDREASGKPLTFFQAAAFQWVNVKALLSAASAIAAFTRPEAFPATMGSLLGVATVVTIMSAVTWTLFGTVLRPLLSDPRRSRVFNVGMAIFLVASLYPMLRG